MSAYLVEVQGLSASGCAPSLLTFHFSLLTLNSPLYLAPMKRTLLLLAAAAGLWSACGDVTPGLSELQPTFVSPSMTPDSLRALLSDAYEAGNFNGAVVICRDGDVEFEEYYGAEEASRRWQAAAGEGKRWTMCAPGEEG